jgi:hypothetical protein
MPNSRRDRKEQQAFLISMLEQAIEIANDVDDHFLDASSSGKTEGEEENSCSQNWNQ